MHRYHQPYPDIHGILATFPSFNIAPTGMESWCLVLRHAWWAHMSLLHLSSQRGSLNQCSVTRGMYGKVSSSMSPVTLHHEFLSLLRYRDQSCFDVEFWPLWMLVSRYETAEFPQLAMLGDPLSANTSIVAKQHQVGMSIGV